MFTKINNERPLISPFVLKLAKSIGDADAVIVREAYCNKVMFDQLGKSSRGVLPNVING